MSKNIYNLFCHGSDFVMVHIDPVFIYLDLILFYKNGLVKVVVLL